jgi:hypothetical protein
MLKGEYMSSQVVIDFTYWLETVLDARQSFVHGYFHKKKRKLYEFDNLYSAYTGYDWDWEYSIEDLSRILMQSIVEHDENSCEDACYKILQWGGVKNRGNIKRISDLSPNLCAYIITVQQRLAMDLSSIDYYFPKIQMTSGFSKIYSACINNYMIYDSRVGAALGLLVRTFCTQSNLRYIPHELRVAWTTGRGEQVRNPSNDRYEFPKLRVYKEGDYLENNIRANWLMSLVASSTKSKFRNIDEPFRLRALEKALFMIGYDIREKDM